MLGTIYLTGFIITLAIFIFLKFFCGGYAEDMETLARDSLFDVTSFSKTELVLSYVIAGLFSALVWPITIWNLCTLLWDNFR